MVGRALPTDSGLWAAGRARQRQREKGSRRGVYDEKLSRKGRGRGLEGGRDAGGGGRASVDN